MQPRTGLSKFAKKLPKVNKIVRINIGRNHTRVWMRQSETRRDRSHSCLVDPGPAGVFPSSLRTQRLLRKRAKEAMIELSERKGYSLIKIKVSNMAPDSTES